MDQDHLHWRIIVDLEFGHTCSCFMSYEFSTKRSAKSPFSTFAILPILVSTLKIQIIEDIYLFWFQTKGITMMTRIASETFTWEQSQKKNYPKSSGKHSNINTPKRWKAGDLPSPDLQETIGTWSSVAPDTKKKYVFSGKCADWIGSNLTWETFHLKFSKNLETLLSLSWNPSYSLYIERERGVSQWQSWLKEPRHAVSLRHTLFGQGQIVRKHCRL